MSVTLKPSNTYNRQKFTVPANGIYTIDFGEMMPNFYRVNNMEDVTLYCATNSLPSEKLYDFKCNPKSVANFSEPKQRNKLYILNPHDKSADIIINYWSGEFDPSFMALGEISINTDTVVQTDGIIKGFTSELPAGDNQIGSVDLPKELKQCIINLGESIGNLDTSNNGNIHQTLSSVIDTLNSLNDNLMVHLPNVTEITNTMYSVEDLISKINKNPTRIIDGSYNGYVMDESWVACNKFGEYVGEILNFSDKIEITTIRAQQFGEEDIQGFTIAEWNKICHIIKAHTVSFVMKENDNNNRIFPYFTVYNY